MNKEKNAYGTLCCSFCGKSQKEVKKLIAGPGVYICDECIELCNDIIAEEREREESSKDFSILGAYPDGQDWDLCQGEPGERPRVLENILRLAQPSQDPLYGSEGPLHREWT